MTERNIPAEIVAQYDDIRFVHKGEIYVQKNINGEICYGIINIKGEEIAPLIPLESKKPNFTVELGKNAKWGVRDKNGNLTVSYKYDDAWDIDGEFFIMKQENKWAIIDCNDNKITPFIYDFIKAFEYRGELIVTFMLNEKWGVLDKKGNIVIQPKYDGVHSVSEGLISVSLSNKYGFIDKEGNEVIPLKYDFALMFSDGFAKVMLNKKWIYIDNTGKPLNPDWCIGNCEDILYTPIKFNGKWSFFDKESKSIISAQDAFESALLKNYTIIESEGKKFLVNNQGIELYSKGNRIDNNMVEMG